MKAKDGYRKQKTDASIGKWLKRYFCKRTCRKKAMININTPVNDGE